MLKKCIVFIVDKVEFVDKRVIKEIFTKIKKISTGMWKTFYIILTK